METVVAYLEIIIACCCGDSCLISTYAIFTKSYLILQEHVLMIDINAAVLKDLILRVLHHPDSNTHEVDHDMHEHLHERHVWKGEDLDVVLRFG